MRKFPLSFFLAALATFAVNSSVWAAPNLWWDHFESTMPNQTECIKKAEAILSAEKAGQTTSDSDSVRSWNEKTVGVTECLIFGDKLIVYVMVGSEDAAAGNALYNALRAGMKN
jgi:hypothetical protein